MFLLFGLGDVLHSLESTVLIFFCNSREHFTSRTLFIFAAWTYVRRTRTDDLSHSSVLPFVRGHCWSKYVRCLDVFVFLRVHLRACVLLGNSLMHEQKPSALFDLCTSLMTDVCRHKDTGREVLCANVHCRCPSLGRPKKNNLQAPCYLFQELCALSQGLPKYDTSLTVFRSH